MWTAFTLATLLHVVFAGVGTSKVPSSRTHLAPQLGLLEWLGPQAQATLTLLPVSTSPGGLSSCIVSCLYMVNQVSQSECSKRTRPSVKVFIRLSLVLHLLRSHLLKWITQPRPKPEGEETTQGHAYLEQQSATLQDELKWKSTDMPSVGEGKTLVRC